jgi:hypothetical protein
MSRVLSLAVLLIVSVGLGGCYVVPTGPPPPGAVVIPPPFVVDRPQCGWTYGPGWYGWGWYSAWPC